jgi:uncharacterized glyoxalase superfamily protein PhnB
MASSFDHPRAIAHAKSIAAQRLHDHHTITKTFWSPRFGMLTDRFGLGWLVSVAT